jgi:hypothetical protein
MSCSSGCCCGSSSSGCPCDSLFEAVSSLAGIPASLYGGTWRGSLLLFMVVLDLLQEVL